MTHSLIPRSSSDPFRDMMNRFFDNKLWPSQSDDWSQFGKFPQVDISETDQSVIVSADIPGIHPDEIDIDIHDGILTLSGSTESEDEDQGKKYYRYERRTGSFSRSFVLPTQVDEDRIEATAKHGVITITLPKIATKEKKKIKITPENE
jgi:HSP20 family protein